MINILHITDFHFIDDRKELVNQEEIVNSILNDLNQKKIDLIIFSGDLVNSGNTIDDFDKASKLLFEQLKEQLKLDNSKIILCSGNHDMNRNEDVRIDAIFKQLDKNIKTNHDLDKYLTETDYSHSIKPLENYLLFQKKFHEKSSTLKHTEDLFSSFQFEINGNKIGVVSINNSWRAIGLDDENNLIFPISKLNESLSYLDRDCDTKILVMHHPFSDFKKFNSYDLKDVVYNNFDILFSGHDHKKETSINFTSKDGIIKIVSPAALTFAGGGHIGYTVFGIDYNENEYLVENRFYDKPVDVFYGAEKLKLEIPSSEEKKEQNRFRKKLKKKFDTELIIANQLLISKESSVDNENAFFEITTQPVLKTQSTSEVTNQEAIIPDFDWDDLLINNEDYLILGKGKCGKTILLKKFQLELLRDYNSEKSIPYYIDLKEWQTTKKVFNLIDELRVYFELNKKDVVNILTNGKITFLIDNFHTKSYLIEEISKVVENNENIRIIACSEETVIKNIEDSKIDGRVLSKLYFHRLRKKQIRTLTNNIFKLNVDKQEEIVEKVNSIFTKLSIPFNFWSVSLFLWVFKKDLNNNFQNDVELINLYIEKLLEKEQLTITQSNFGFDKYKRFLSSLAHKMLIEYHNFSYSMTYAELNNFTEDYLKENIRYTISSREVLDYIEDRGILMKRVDERYTFRLKGVFEYFLANQLVYDKKFLKTIIKDDNLYLSFSNEFELYAGFKRDDEKFLKKIYKKTKSIYKKINVNFDNSGSTIDSLLKSKILELNELKPMIDSISESLKEGLSSDKKDQMEESVLQEIGIDEESQSEVKKKEVQVIDESIETLEKSIFILGRVFKNVDEVKSNNKVHDIFDYIISSSCQWGFKVIDEIKLNDFNDLIKIENEDDAQKLLKIVTNFIPTLVQARVNDMLGDKNLENVVNDEINILIKDKKNNQYKLFILYFLLLDINLVKYKDRIDEIIELITIPVLRYSILLKLNYYLGFKINNNDKNLVQFLRGKIQKEQFIFNDKTDVGNFHQSLDNKKKIKPKD
jgi:predicted phosphodiesterase